MIGQLTRRMDGIFCFTKEKTTFHGIPNYDEKLYKISMTMKRQDILEKLEHTMQYANTIGGQAMYIREKLCSRMWDMPTIQN